MGARDHLYWVVGGAVLALAGEGFQHVGGETLAHSVGVAPSLLYVGGATALSWLWSSIVDQRKPEAPKPHAKPKAKAPAKRKPRR